MMAAECNISASVTDLSILQRFIDERHLPYAIGPSTTADGNCFLHAMLQNFQHFKSLGHIEKVPEDVNVMRQEIINFMVENKSFFIGKCGEDGVLQPGPLDEDSFRSLIEDQRKPGAYTDLDGWFVLWSCKYFGVQLQILQTNMQGPVIESGMAGPIVTINRANEGEKKLIFHMGLIKIEGSEVGHYQFITQKSSETSGGLPRVERQHSSSLVSPIKLKRSRIVKSYLKSPSPKKLPTDGGHCLFCPTNIASAEQLDVHLSQSAPCRRDYLQCLKTKDLDSYLISLSPCFFCKFVSSVHQFRITTHLRKNSTNCFEKYCRKFGVETLSEIVKEIEKLKRKLRDHRSRARRRIETERRREKLEDKAVKQTMTDLVNQFRQNTSLTNTRHCCNCHANMPDSRAEELKIVPPAVADKLDCRRFQKFFVCNRCKDQELGDREFTINPNIMLRRTQMCESTVFVPSCRYVEEQGTEEQLPEEYSMEKVFFPCNVQSINLFPNKKIAPRYIEAPSIMYKVGPLSEEAVSVMFENELHKYIQAAKKGDKFSGVIKDDRLTSTERVIMDHVIIGSDKWKISEARDKIFKKEQFGSIICSFSISVPVSIDIRASCLIQNGHVITLNYIEEANGDFDISYRIHDHKTEEDCNTESCQTELLPDFLQTTDEYSESNVIKNHLSTYVSNTVLRMNNFVRVFLKSKASDLYSEDFSVELKFEQNGLIKIEGYIWPKFLEDLNVNFSTYPHKSIEPELKEKCLNYADSVLTASTDPTTLKNQFNLSESESLKVASLAKANQFHLCRDKDCTKCISPSMPSLLTLFVETPSPDCLLNVETAKLFNKMILVYLKSTSEAEIQSTSSADWLENLFKNIVLETQEILEDVYRIKTIQNGTFDFMKDERFKELSSKFTNQLLAAFHYSISCGEVASSFGCVIQRKNLVDCYTRTYNISILKAFRGPMVFNIVNGHNEIEIEEQSVDNVESADVELLASHNLINLSEAVTLFDRQLSRSSNSTVVEYANTSLDRKMYFRKVSEESDHTYKDEHGGLFERAPSNIDRYLHRRNGESVTLMEFLSYYDFSGVEESRQLMKIFRQPESNINPSEIKCAHNAEYLPEFIVTKLDDVMKLRSRRKVIVYPRYADNPGKLEISKVLLFYPMFGDTDEDVIKKMAKEVDESGANIIDRNER